MSKTVKFYAAAAAVLFCLSAAFALSAPREEKFLRDVNDAEAFALILSNAGNPAFHVIDVRTPGEFEPAHLSNAANVNVNAPDFADRMAGMNRADVYLVYCKSGSRSARASGTMRDMGFERIYNMTGGITAWIADGYPVVKP